MPAFRTRRGFTLIELLIVIAILAILATISYPSLRNYVQRGRVPTALDSLTAIGAKMELAYQDNNGSYGAGPACPIAVGTATDFALSCTITGGGSGYVARATGYGKMLGYTYSLKQDGSRATEAHPKGYNTSCWTTKGTACDT